MSVTGLRALFAALLLAAALSGADAREQGIGGSADAVDCLDRQTRGHDVRRAQGSAVGDRPGRDERDAAGGHDLVDWGVANHLQVTVGRAGRHVDRARYLHDKWRSGAADRATLGEGCDGLGGHNRVRFGEELRFLGFGFGLG